MTLKRRVDKLSANLRAQRRVFFSTFDGLEGEALERAEAEERKRLGIGENDIHFVEIRLSRPPGIGRGRGGDT